VNSICHCCGLNGCRLPSPNPAFVCWSHNPQTERKWGLGKGIGSCSGTFWIGLVPLWKRPRGLPASSVMEGCVGIRKQLSPDIDSSRSLMLDFLIARTVRSKFLMPILFWYCSPRILAQLLSPHYLLDRKLCLRVHIPMSEENSKQVHLLSSAM
jgi:hypothetical protein